MRHRVEGRKFGREKAHRTAMFRNLVKSIIVSPQGRIETTEAKAKSLRSVVDRLITYAKKDSVASRRLAYSVLGNRTLVKKLFEEVAPLMAERNGGYTRVLKTGYRKGDSAPMAIIEFVKAETQHEEKKHDEKKAKGVKKAKAEKPAAKLKATDLLDQDAEPKEAKKTVKKSTKKVKEEAVEAVAETVEAEVEASDEPAPEATEEPEKE